MKQAVQQHARDEFRQDVWDELARDDALRRHRLRRRGRRGRARRARRRARRARTSSAATASTTSRCRRRAFPTIVGALGERAKRDRGWTRLIVEKPFGHDLASARELNQHAVGALRRERDLPDRPLPRQGDGPEHARAAVRERHLRADLEPPVHRPRADHGRRVDRDRGPRRLLRVRRARSATSSRTTCCSCSRSPRWSRRSTSPPTRCATRR